MPFAEGLGNGSLKPQKPLDHHLPAPPGGFLREGMSIAHFTYEKTNVRDGGSLVQHHTASQGYNLGSVRSWHSPPLIISTTPGFSPPPQLSFSQLVWTREVPPIWATKGLDQCHLGSASPGAPLCSGRCLRGDQLRGGGTQGNVRAHVWAALADSPVSRAERGGGNELGGMKREGPAGWAGLRVAAPGWRSAQGWGVY